MQLTPESGIAIARRLAPGRSSPTWPTPLAPPRRRAPTSARAWARAAQARIDAALRVRHVAARALAAYAAIAPMPEAAPPEPTEPPGSRSDGASVALGPVGLARRAGERHDDGLHAHGRAAPVPASEGRAGDRYLLALGACLLGYALMGRAFAYVGVPPVFIGEVMLALGLALTLRLSGLDRLAHVGPFWVLLALQVLTVVRSVPYFGLYGLDVARDAMLFGYGFYAYVVYLLVVDRPSASWPSCGATGPSRSSWWRSCGCRTSRSASTRHGSRSCRARPTSASIEAKGGDLLVHLSGIGAFLLLGLRRPSWPVTVALAVTPSS